MSDAAADSDVQYVWHGEGIGWIMDSVQEGCAMGTQRPLQKLQAGVPFTVVELRTTAVGAQGTPKLYGRVVSPVAGWVDLTSSQCEKVQD